MNGLHPAELFDDDLHTPPNQFVVHDAFEMMLCFAGFVPVIVDAQQGS